MQNRTVSFYMSNYSSLGNRTCFVLYSSRHCVMTRICNNCNFRVHVQCTSLIQICNVYLYFCIFVFLYLCVCIWVFSHRNAPQCALFNPNVQWVQCVGLIPGSAGIAPINTVNKYNWQGFWHFGQFLHNLDNWIVNINNITATRDIMWTQESFRQLGPESTGRFDS